MSRAAAVSGLIVDEDFDPVSGVPVQLWAITYRNGRRELASVPDARTTTDDRGMYRISGVVPGRYYVSAFHVHTVERRDAPEDHLRYVRTFHPGAIDPAAATAIHLSSGSEMENINWKVAKVRTVSVSGRVRGGPQSVVSLSPDGMLSSNDASLHRSGIAPDGTFEFGGVVPGAYILSVDGQGEAWAFRHIVVGAGGVAGLTLALNPLIRLDGRVRMEGDTLEDVSQIVVGLRPLFLVHFSATQQPVSKGATFAWDKLMPGQYRLTLSGLPAGYYLKSIRLGQRTLPDGRLLDFTSGASQTLELELSVKAGRVSGIVESAGSGEPVPEATVILVPDEAHRRGDLSAYSPTLTDSVGHFTLNNLPPGSYHAYAIHTGSENLFMDPASLEPYESGAVGLTIAEGGQVNIKLTWKR